MLRKIEKKLKEKWGEKADKYPVRIFIKLSDDFFCNILFYKGEFGFFFYEERGYYYADLNDLKFKDLFKFQQEKILGGI